MTAPEPRSCKACNQPIVWVQRPDGKWNRPLNAESAQAGFCVVDGIVRYTFMYTAHVCSADDMQAYQNRRNVQEIVAAQEIAEQNAQRPVIINTPEPDYYRQRETGESDEAREARLDRAKAAANEIVQERGGVVHTRRVEKTVAEEAAEKALRQERDYRYDLNDPEFRRAADNLGLPYDRRLWNDEDHGLFFKQWKRNQNYTELDLGTECPVCKAKEGEYCTSMNKSAKSVIYNVKPHNDRILAHGGN